MSEEAENAAKCAQQWRLRIKTGLFLALPWLFRHTGAYRHWNENLLAGRSYADWIRRRERPAFGNRTAIAKAIVALPRHPRFGIVLPVDGADASPISRSVASVLAQSYPHWTLHLVVAGQSSPPPKIAHAMGDPRVRIEERLDPVDTEFLAVLQPGDALAEHACYWLARTALSNPTAKVIYSDHDLMDDTGKRGSPHFKPDWNADLFYSTDFVSPFMAFDTGLLRAADRLAALAAGEPPGEVLLDCLPGLPDQQIAHVPWILYHRQGPPASPGEHPVGTIPPEPAGWPGGQPDRLPALRRYFDRRGLPALVEPGPLPGTTRVRFPVPEPAPLVSLLIPTRDQLDLVRACVESILAKTTYRNFEILILDNQSQQPETRAWLAAFKAHPQVRVVPCDGPFNYSAINNLGAREARGEMLGLINNDIEVIAPDWLGEMVSHACRPEIGCVGAKLLYGDGTVQHAGIVLGIRRGAAHPYRHAARTDPGYFGRLCLTQNVSAVSAACLLVRRQLWEQLGGLNETDLPIDFNDVDLCLRTIEAGYRNVWTPWAELYHHEGASRGRNPARDDQARHRRAHAYLLSRWGAFIEHDPAYNPNLTRYLEDYTLG